MKLTVESKKNLLKSAKQVYKAYAALDFFKTRTFAVDQKPVTLIEQFQVMVTNNVLLSTIEINGNQYVLNLQKQKDNHYKASIAPQKQQSSKAEVKNISTYNDEEVMALLCSHEFDLELSDTQLHVATNLAPSLTLGGKDKVDLYRTHLVTLNHIINKIASEDDLTNLLVALATGAGKTFVQALWILILTHSNNHGIFAIPDKLAHQFARDLKTLLPDNLVNSFLMLRDADEDHPELDQAIKNLALKDTAGTILLGSSERLLDHYYQELIDADSNRTFLSFDEQHLIMKVERRRVRLMELAKQKLSLFLTATPNQETYQLSGNKPVAIMSSGQKKEAGQGQFPRLLSVHARNISDRNTFKDFRFWTGNFWKTILNGLSLRVTNAVQGELSSAAVSVVEQLPFQFTVKEGEVDPRWAIQVPAARKMLVIIDDNETLVNFCYALSQGKTNSSGFPYYYQDSSEGRRDVYSNGNVVQRSDVASFFGLPDAELDIIAKDMTQQKQAFKEAIKPHSQKDKPLFESQSLKQNLKNTIFHNLVEYVLTDITGLDEITHNAMRKSNFNGFKGLITQKIQLKEAAYYQTKLEQVIDKKGAAELGVLLEKLNHFLWSTYQATQQAIVTNDHIKSDLQEKLDTFIDNCPFDATALGLLDYVFSSRFASYANQHLMIGLMSGMKDAETPLDESRPFSNLSCTISPMYDADGALVPTAKKRKHTSLEIISDTSQEALFTPVYLDFETENPAEAERIADAYFRLGFVGAYVSNKKTEGFSDRNLHTVINIAENTVSKTNSPDTQIQGIGRNRGLDSNVEPVFIHGLGRNQQTVFDLNHLQKNDYYPDLFQAQKRYNSKFIKVLGTEVGKQIITWIIAHTEVDETINAEQLKRQVLKFIALALRDLNNRNNHHIKLSRSQLTKVVGYAMKELDREMAHQKKPYTLSLFLKSLGSVLNFISELFYTTLRIPVAIKLRMQKPEQLKDQRGQLLPKNQADSVYKKIITHNSFKKIIANMAPALEIKNWLHRKTLGFEKHLNQQLFNYLKEDVAASWDKHQKQLIEPVIFAAIEPSKLDLVKAAFKTFPDIRNYLLSKTDQLAVAGALNEQSFNLSLLNILQGIPGLQDLKGTDILHLSVQNAKQLIDDLSNKAEEFTAFITDYNSNKEDMVDKTLIATQVGDYLFPVLFHPQFIKVSEHLIGYLKKEELTVLLRTMRVPGSNNNDELDDESAQDAKSLLRILHLIKKRSKQQIIDEFFTVPEDGSVFDIDDLPAKKMFDLLTDLFEEVLDSHCHYNSCSRKGEPSGYNYVDKSNCNSILDAISRPMTDITIPVKENFIHRFARKVFYINGIKNGLKPAGEVNAAANEHLMLTIKRVKTHLLRPIWWSANVSTLSHSFILLCRNAVDTLIAVGYTLLNAGKRVLNKMIRSTHFKVTLKNPDSRDFNDTAFDFTQQMIALRPYTQEQVKHRECAEDVVVQLERFVQQPKACIRFFDNKSEEAVVDEVLNNENKESFSL